MKRLCDRISCLLDIDIELGSDRTASLVVVVKPDRAHTHGAIGRLQTVLNRYKLISSKIVYRKSGTVDDQVLLLVDAPDSFLRGKAMRRAVEGWKKGGAGQELRLPPKKLADAERLLHLAYVPNPVH